MPSARSSGTQSQQVKHPGMKYKTLSKNAENDTQQMQAAQLIHSSHLPLSADNSPARRPASPLIIHLKRVRRLVLPQRGFDTLYRREFLWFLHVLFGN